MDLIDVLKLTIDSLTQAVTILQKIDEHDRRLSALETQGHQPDRNQRDAPASSTQGDGEGGDEPSPETDNESDSEPVDLSTITADPSTWPLRDTHLSNRCILKGMVHRPNDIDRTIIAILRTMDLTDEQGTTLRNKMARLRRLTLKQIRSLSASWTRANPSDPDDDAGNPPVHTHDPRTWTKRPVLVIRNEGFPPVGTKDYPEVDEVDMGIMIAIMRHVDDDRVLWKELKMAFCKARQLNPQQAAGLKAVISREGLAA